MSSFEEWIATAQSRLTSLQTELSQANGSQATVVPKTFSELQNALDELQVADEELHQHRDELIIARQMVETERRRYQELFDFAPGAYLITDTGGIIQEANQAAAALLAVPWHRLQGKSFGDFVASQERRAFRQRLPALAQVDKADIWEVRLRPHGGLPLYAEVRVASFRDENGRVVGLRWLLHDVSEWKAAQQRTSQAEQALQQSHEQLRALTLYVQWQQEEERRRIAREIHDELGQMLTVLKIDVAWLMKRQRSERGVAYERLAAMSGMLDSLTAAVRRIGTELRPAVLDDLGLTAAIEWQLQEVQKRTGLSYALTVPEKDFAIDQARATGMFRIFQEALTNVLRHAEARGVRVKLVRQAEALVLEIADDGRGITATQLAHPSSLGLLSMRERALLLGGSITITGKPSKGTIVTLSLPYWERQTKGSRHDSSLHRR